MNAISSGLERFAGRKLGVATSHAKEQVIGPLLKQALGLSGYSAIADMDTDRFGAFSGEVQRTLDPLAACEAKARHGAEVSGFDLVIASEGSFGPYPPAPFLSCDEEFLVLFDALDGRTFHHRHVSLETVFDGEACTDWTQANAFAQRMKFPSHHLVVRPLEKWKQGDTQFKGLQDKDAFRNAVEGLLEHRGSCWVETDMRAMANPTRMRVIADTAVRFADELTTTCPVCQACWFRITHPLAGLPCELCGWPTASTRAYLHTCWACAHAETRSRPDGKRFEEPQHCGNCNP
ncbi:MAG: hypothetical protein IPN38_07930 [Flavobacteriales bacterium]|nr:hypothetical protein [Flavobacteriales bacterium]